MTADNLVPEPTLRLATIDDRDALVAVHTASREQAYAGHLPAALLHQYSLDDQRAFWSTRLAGDDPNAMTWVAIIDGDLAGFCHAGSPIGGSTADALHVHSLYVSPDHQGQGLGRVLLERTVMTIAARGFPKATLHVYGFNEPAQRFYEHLGWRRVAPVELLRWEGEPVVGYRYEKLVEPLDAAVPAIG